MIDQEDQNQLCSSNCNDNDQTNNLIIRSSNSSSSSSSSKKLKQAKVPQRGLGVAQLEKIRLEEQQKNDAKNPPPPQPPPPQPPPPSSVGYRTVDITPSASAGPNPPPPPSPLPLLRAHSMPNVGNNGGGGGGGFGSGSSSSSSTSGNSLGWPSIPVHGKVDNLTKLWSSNSREFCNDWKRENSNHHHNHTLLRDSTTCSSTSLANNGSTTTFMNPSMTNFPMIEPPSNQTYVTNYLPSWTDDQKVMLGMKRPCPFSIDDPPIPKFRTTFAPITNPLTGPTEDPTPCQQNGGSMHAFDPPIFRDFRSCPRATHEAATSSIRKSIKPQSTGNSNEELLAPSFPSSLSRHLKALPYQVSYDDPYMNSRNGGTSQQPRCICLFPSTELQSTSESPPSPNSHNACNGEVAENIDLNLRL